MWYIEKMTTFLISSLVPPPLVVADVNVAFGLAAIIALCMLFGAPLLYRTEARKGMPT